MPWSLVSLVCRWCQSLYGVFLGSARKTEGALRTIGATLLQTSNLSRADIELIPSVEFDTIHDSATFESALGWPKLT